jgi:copper homeostasis protein
MPEVLLEVCVDSLAGLRAAIEGGADRIELCAALEVGGLTPSVGLMQAAAGCGVPVLAMIRPRSGDFAYHAGEVAMMRADIAAVRAAGLSGVVLGATRRAALDRTVLADLVETAQGLDLALHRAVDLCDDATDAVETAVALGFQRILSSGGAATAMEGLPRLAEMISAARGRIAIMPGAGVSAETANLLRALRVTQVHASCSVPGPAAPMGFGAPRVTSADRVLALKAALLTWG